MRSTIATLVAMLVLIAVVTVTATSADILTLPEYNQCDTTFQMFPADSTMCQNGHVLTALAMAMTHRAPKTHFDANPRPQYTPNQLAAALLLKNLSPTTVFAPTFSPHLLIPHLSSNIHHTISFSPVDLTDEQVQQFCLHSAESPVYIVDTTDSSTVWVNHCHINPKTNQMTITAHHPRHGVQHMTWSEFVSISNQVHELYISHNQFQQKTFAAWTTTHSQLEQLVAPRHKVLESVFKRQSESIYKQLGAEDEWVIPHTYFISWKQGDYPNDIMTKQSVAAVGCLMCSVAVGLRNRNITLPGNVVVEPHAWNEYIKANNGYDNDNFIHTVINPICDGRPENCYTHYDERDARHPTNDLTVDQVKALLDESKRHVVANVNGGRHFVPLIGYSKTNPTRFKTLDSAGGTHGREWFDHSEIVGYRLYDLTGPFDKKGVFQTMPCSGL